MKIVMFDLDGTLLPMDQDVFVNGYFSFLAKKMAPHGYEPQKLVKAIWGGTAAMVKNDGTCTNEEAFWRFFTGVYGEGARADIPLFEEFYANEFQRARQFCGFDARAAEAVALVKARGAVPVLAPEAAEMTVDAVSLMRSDRGKHGMLYTELARFPAGPGGF